MANASVAQSVNRQSVALALREARKECGQHLRWLNALNRAALNLEACPWQFDGDVLVIASASDGSSRYIVTAEGCECKAAQAGRPCWHRASHRSPVNAAELAAVATRNVTQQDSFHIELPSFEELTAAVNAALFN